MYVCSPPLAVLFEVLCKPGWLFSMLMTGRRFDALFATIGIVGFYTVIGVCIHALLRPRVPSPGYCVNCEYNLTGNESGVCPECGAEIEQP